MAPRPELHELLKTVLGSDHVYFQAPPNVGLEYPCIVYKRDYAISRFSNNRPYTHEKRYLVTVIDRNPDSEIPARVAALPKCLFDRFFTAKNLNHERFQR